MTRRRPRTAWNCCDKCYGSIHGCAVERYSLRERATQVTSRYSSRRPWSWQSPRCVHVSPVSLSETALLTSTRPTMPGLRLERHTPSSRSRHGRVCDVIAISRETWESTATDVLPTRPHNARHCSRSGWNKAERRVVYYRSTITTQTCVLTRKRRQRRISPRLASTRPPLHTSTAPMSARLFMWTAELLHSGSTVRTHSTKLTPAPILSCRWFLSTPRSYTPGVVSWFIRATSTASFPLSQR
mmetsp:Transcript_49017/g.115159  ORF Transcript_49017/g.115159 Transcript_49017/m.115159 type:complete len:242 (+) Transcript_49017:431-1156(+)